MAWLLRPMEIEAQHFELPHCQSAALLPARDLWLAVAPPVSSLPTRLWRARARDQPAAARTRRSRAESLQPPSRDARARPARARALPAPSRFRRARRPSERNRPHLRDAAAPMSASPRPGRQRHRPRGSRMRAADRSAPVAAMSRSSSSAFCASTVARARSARGSAARGPRRARFCSAAAAFSDSDRPALQPP